MATTRKAAKKAAKKPKRTGRPSRLTPAVHLELVRMLTKGAYLSHAAGAVGIDRRTVTKWIQRGRDDIEAGEEKTRYAKFAAEAEQAMNRGAVAMAEVVHDAAQRDWRAALAYLERRHPREWGPTRAVDVRHSMADDAGEGALDEDLAELNDGELELLERTLVKAGRVLEIGRKRRG